MTVLDIDSLVNKYEKYTIALFQLYRNLDYAFAEKINTGKNEETSVNERIVEYRTKILRIREERDEIERNLSFFGIVLKFDALTGANSFRVKDFSEYTKELFQLYRALSDMRNAGTIVKDGDSHTDELSSDSQVNVLEEQIYIVKEKRNETEQELSKYGESLSVSFDKSKIEYPKQKKNNLKPNKQK